MLQMLEVMLADGKELDIPHGSVVMFNELNKDSNPNFPNARSFIRYILGDGLNTGILSTPFEDLIFELGVNTAPPGKWLRLTRKDTGLRVILPVENVVSRTSLDEGCRISYRIGQDVESVEVNESRREIKKWSERGDGPSPVAANEEN
jgi:hypothetical protein